MAFVFNPFTGNLDVTDDFGVIVSGFTSGGVVFAESGSLQVDASNFFYDNTNNALGLGTNTGFDADDKLLVYPGSDIQATIGNTMIGYGGLPSLSLSIISHRLQNTVTTFAIGQLADGTTYVNSAPGTSVNLSSGFTAIAQLTPGSFTLTGGNNLVLNGVTSGYTLIETPAVSGSYNLRLPVTTSTTNDVLLSTAGSGVLNFGKVANANIDSSAAIAVSKLAALTASRVVATDGSGFLTTGPSVAVGGIFYGDSTNVIENSTTFVYDKTGGGIGINETIVGIDATIDAITVRNVIGLKIVAFSGQTASNISIHNSASAKLFGVDASGRIELAAGALGTATGSFYGLSDTNTGMFYDAADSMSFFTNGTTRLAVTNAGVTVRSGVLDVPATLSTTVPVYTLVGDGNTGLGTPAADQLVLITGGATRIRTNSTGTMIGSSTSPVGIFNIFSNSVEAFWLTGTVNTTDNTQTTLITFTTASNIAYHLEADVVGRRTGGTGGTAGDSSAWKITAKVKNIAGTLTLSAVTTVLSAEDNAATDCTFTVSGTAIRVSVTGDTNNNYTFDGLWKLVRV